MKIHILTDRTSWMNKYNLLLQQRLQELGHVVRMISSKEELEEGDVAFFLSCFEIVTEDFLKLNKHNIVVHESALPAGKGWSPLTWQILEGKNSIPICLFEASSLCDSGDIYLSDTIEFEGHELVDELRQKQGEKTIELSLEFIKRYSEVSGIPQTGNESYYLKRTAKDSELDLNKTLEEQFNLLRIVDNVNYPAFFMKDGIKYILKVEKC